MNQNYGTGRRKSAKVRSLWSQEPEKLRLTKELDEYFGRETARMIVRQPLEVVDASSKFDFNVSVTGGGVRTGWGD